MAKQGLDMVTQEEIGQITDVESLRRTAMVVKAREEETKRQQAIAKARLYRWLEESAKVKAMQYINCVRDREPQHVH